MRVIRAEHLGMCFGVRDAIALALKESKDSSLTVLGELVHNEAVLEGLKRRGVRIASDLDSVETPTVMITAHGASDKMLEAARARASRVIEGTCPLVHLAHRAVARLVGEGFHPVIIGKREHVEVRGLTGDLEDFDV